MVPYLRCQYLQSMAGTATWLTEYVPIQYETRYIIERLLRKFFDFGIFCQISESFSEHTAEKFHFFTTVTLWYLNNKFLKLGPSSTKEGGGHKRFTLGHFIYFKYTVTFGDVSISFILLPVDTSTECEPHSNLKFVHFVGIYFAFFLSKNTLQSPNLPNHLVFYIRNITGLRVEVGFQTTYFKHLHNFNP
jgi:hypothetical protein